MSSCGNPSTDHEQLMPRRLRFDKGKDCIKCKAKPGRIVTRHAVYCKECFIPFVTLKFRRSLEPYVNADAGTSKGPRLKASGSLVLGFSGGLGSSILADMIYKTYFTRDSCVDDKPRGGTNHPRSANVWASCAVCYVEVCNAFPETCDDKTKEIRKALAPYPKFDFIPLRLEHAFDVSWWRTITMTDQDQLLATELGKDGLYTEALRYAPSCGILPVDALRAYLGSLPTQTAISSAIRVLIRLLLLYTAQSRQASHLLLGTSLTTLSISLISCISQGGGHSISEELHEEWHSGTLSKNGNTVRVVRPLKDVTIKECSIFAWWNSIYATDRNREMRATDGTIPGLTKDFIIGLEKDYPSTVSTIVRTCAKLEPKGASLGLCILCQRPIQEGIDDWKTRISIRSYSDKKVGPDLVYSPTPISPNDAEISATSDQFQSISTHLCYFCQTTFTSRGSRAHKSTLSRVVSEGQSPQPAPLPLWASASFARLRSQDKQLIGPKNSEVEPQGDANLRSKIANFLLDS